MYIIPANNAPNRTFRITIPIDGGNKTFRFKFVYNSIGKYWMLTIMDLSGNEIVSNLNLLQTFGEKSSNLLEQLAYLRVGSAYLVDLEAFTFSAPTDEQLGNKYALLWGDTE